MLRLALSPSLWLTTSETPLSLPPRVGKASSVLGGVSTPAPVLLALSPKFSSGWIETDKPFHNPSRPPSSVIQRSALPPARQFLSLPPATKP